MAQTFTLTLQPNTVPAVTQGVAYNQAITAVGGNSNYSLAITSGSLPPGIALTGGAGSWALTGTSNAPGSYSFTITATDIDGNTGFRPYSLSIGTAGGLSVNPASLPNGTQGIAYSQTVTASGGSGGYVYSISAGSLPTGLSLNSGTGAITGTPSAGGTFNFTVHALDSDGNTGNRAYSVYIGTNSLTVLPASLPNGTQGTAYSQTATASGGTGPYTFAISSGALPTGLSLAANGNITGTPSAPGSFSFTIRATDSILNFGTRNYTVNIGSNVLTVAPPTLPNGTVGTGYSQTITASGGSAPYSFSVISGSLPTGLSLSGAGVLSGTPTASGPFTFTVQATDPGFNTGSQIYSVTINAAPLTINPASLPAATLGTAYSQTVVASGGSAPYSYSVLSGSLPTGLSLAGATGVISGTPSATGSFSFTVQATDATPNTGTRAYTINVGSNILTVSPAGLPNGTQNTAYSQTVTASGGTGPYTFAITSGSLPTGLSLSSGGVISGTPTGSGVSSFTVGATDSVGNTGARAYTVNIGTVSLTVSPASLPAGSQNVAYSQTVTASGGTGPYTFALSSGALPAGLTLSSAGVISGTPTASGASAFTVQATDTLGNTGSRAYAVNIGTASLTINPASLPPAIVGRAYSQTLIASGGTAPYTFSIAAGALPAGLTLDAATGIISGTPTQAGAAAFTVSVVDVNGNTGSRAYTFSNRVDPASDPEVRGLITAQVAAAQRFASAQSDNITRHLESLHGEFNPCSFNFGIAPPTEPNAPYQQPPYAGYGALPPYGTVDQAGRPIPGSSACAADWASSMAFWTAGSYQFGTMTPGGAQLSNHFNSAGLTAGVDLRVSDRLIVGIAGGYGGDQNNIGGNGTRSSATAYSGTLYGSLRPFNPIFLDGAIGYGRLSFDNHRYVTGDGSMADGKRNGSYWFGAVEASFEMTNGQVKVAPYIGGNYLSATLDSYSETGASTQLLNFEQSTFSATSAAVGLRGSIDIPVSFGVLTPTARVEYRQTYVSSYDQSMYYSDIGSGFTSTFTQSPGTQSTTTGALGLRARAPGGMSAELEYGVSSGTGSLWMQGIRAALRLPF